jgi:hypothetical protein
VEDDRAATSAKREGTVIRDKYKAALDLIEQQRQAIDTLAHLNANVEPYRIRPAHGSGTSEATAVILASDWHVEEIVNPAVVSNLNSYNPEIAEARARKFFQSSARLLALLKQDVKIPTVVLGLLGDFITGQIHGAENAEANALLPNDALVFAENQLIAGIEFLLSQHTGKLYVPCHSGNHARTTHTTRFTSENGHSLEYLMYRHLASYFRHEPRVTFEVAQGYHSYLPVYNWTLRFHHGHAAKFQGGVGGLYIPVNKKLAQWDKARRADLDCFGHFHQMKDGGKFVSNGSLIGYNAYAQSIGADFEPPRQTLFLMDKKRGRTCTWPIIVTE